MWKKFWLIKTSKYYVLHFAPYLHSFFGKYHCMHTFNVCYVQYKKKCFTNNLDTHHLVSWGINGYWDKLHIFFLNWRKKWNSLQYMVKPFLLVIWTERRLKSFSVLAAKWSLKDNKWWVLKTKQNQQNQQEHKILHKQQHEQQHKQQQSQ